MKFIKDKAFVKRLGLAVLAGLTCFLFIGNTVNAEEDSYKYTNQYKIGIDYYLSDISAAGPTYVIDVNTSQSNKNTVSSGYITSNDLWTKQLAGFRLNNPGTDFSNGNDPNKTHQLKASQYVVSMGEIILSSYNEAYSFPSAVNPNVSVYRNVINKGKNNPYWDYIIAEHNERAKHILLGTAVDKNTGDIYGLTQVGEHSEVGYAVTFINPKHKFKEGANLMSRQEAEELVGKKLISGELKFNDIDTGNYIYFVTSDNPDRCFSVIKTSDGKYTKLYGSVSNYNSYNGALPSCSFVDAEYDTTDPITTTYEIHDNLYILKDGKVEHIKDTYAGSEVASLNPNTGNLTSTKEGDLDGLTNYDSGANVDLRQQVFWCGTLNLIQAIGSNSYYDEVHNGSSLNLGQYIYKDGQFKEQILPAMANSSRINNYYEYLKNAGVSESIANIAKSNVVGAGGISMGNPFSESTTLPSNWSGPEEVKYSTPSGMREIITRKFFLSLKDPDDSLSATSWHEKEFNLLLNLWANGTGNEHVYEEYLDDKNCNYNDNYYVAVIFPLMGYSTNTINGNGNIVDYQRDIYLGTMENAIAFACSDVETSINGAVYSNALTDSITSIITESKNSTEMVSKIYNKIKGINIDNLTYKTISGSLLPEYTSYSNMSPQEMMFNFGIPSVCSLWTESSNFTGYNGEVISNNCVSVIVNPLSKLESYMQADVATGINKNYNGAIGKYKTNRYVTLAELLSEPFSNNSVICRTPIKKNNVAIMDSFDTVIPSNKIQTNVIGEKLNRESINIRYLVDKAGVGYIYDPAYTTASNFDIFTEEFVLMNRNYISNSSIAQKLLSSNLTAPSWNNRLFSSNHIVLEGECNNINHSNGNNASDLECTNDMLLLDLFNFYSGEVGCIAELYYWGYSNVGSYWRACSTINNDTTPAVAVCCGNDIPLNLEGGNLFMYTNQDIAKKSLEQYFAEWRATNPTQANRWEELAPWPTYDVTVGAKPKGLASADIKRIASLEDERQKILQGNYDTAKKVAATYPYMFVLTCRIDPQTTTGGSAFGKVDVTGSSVPFLNQNTIISQNLLGYYETNDVNNDGVVDKPANSLNGRAWDDFLLYGVYYPKNGTSANPYNTAIPVSNNGSGSNYHPDNGRTYSPLSISPLRLYKTSTGQFDNSRVQEPNPVYSGYVDATGIPNDNNDNTYGMAFRVNGDKMQAITTAALDVAFNFQVTPSAAWTDYTELSIGTYFEFYIVCDSDFDGDFNNNMQNANDIIIFSKGGDAEKVPSSIVFTMRKSTPETWLKFSDKLESTANGIVVANTPIVSSSPNANMNAFLTPATWNASTGIPSTENLCVITGGDMYHFCISGYEIHDGIRTSANRLYDAGLITNVNSLTNGTGYSGKNEKGEDWALNRKIQIHVDILNYWGETNTACSLSCDGSHAIFSRTGASSPTCPTDTSVGNATKPAVSWSCDVCGATGQYTYAPGQNEQTCPGPSGTESKCSHGQGGSHQVSPATSGSWSGGHSCSWSASFNCATGNITTNATVTASDITAATASSTKQGYSFNSATFKCGTKSYSQDSTYTFHNSSSNIIHDGYTTGYGHTCSNNTNMYHHTTSSSDFFVYERVDYMQSRQIEEWYVENLGYTVTAEPTQNSHGLAFEDMFYWNSGNMIGCSSLSKQGIWRTTPTFETNSYFGRVSFSLFKPIENVGEVSIGAYGFKSEYFPAIDFSLSSGGSTGTEHTGQTRYYLGDAYILIQATADSECIYSGSLNRDNLTASIATLNNIKDSYGNVVGWRNASDISVSTTRGKDVDQTKTPSTTSFSDGTTGHCKNFPGANEGKGDAMSSTEVLALKLYLVNKWQGTQDVSTVYSVSDIVDDTYEAVDPKNVNPTPYYSTGMFTQTIQCDVWQHPTSIPLFNSDFTYASETHYRTHVHPNNHAYLGKTNSNVSEYINKGSLKETSWTENENTKNLVRKYVSLIGSNDVENLNWAYKCTGINASGYIPDGTPPDDGGERNYISINVDADGNHINQSARDMSILYQLRYGDYGKGTNIELKWLDMNEKLRDAYDWNSNICGSITIFNKACNSFSSTSALQSNAESIDKFGFAETEIIHTNVDVNVLNISDTYVNGTLASNSFANIANDITRYFDGYYATYYYPSIINKNGGTGTECKTTGIKTEIFHGGVGYGSGVSGSINIKLYGTSWVVPNVKIKAGVPNGKYANPWHIYNTYSLMNYSPSFSKGALQSFEDGNYLAAYVGSVAESYYNIYNAGFSASQRLCGYSSDYESSVRVGNRPGRGVNLTNVSNNTNNGAILLDSIPFTTGKHILNVGAYHVDTSDKAAFTNTMNKYYEVINNLNNNTMYSVHGTAMTTFSLEDLQYVSSAYGNGMVPIELLNTSKNHDQILSFMAERSLPLMNDITIHTPLANENCKVISNEVASLLGSYTKDWYSDNSDSDLRDLDSEANSSAYTNGLLDDYAVVGNNVYIWYSDIGNFATTGDSKLFSNNNFKGLTAYKQSYGKTTDNMPIYNTLTKKYVVDMKTGNDYFVPPASGIPTTKVGYTGEMNTSRWVESRHIKFPCAVSYVAYEKQSNGTYKKVNKVAPAGTWIDLSEVSVTVLGNSISNGTISYTNDVLICGDINKENSGASYALGMDSQNLSSAGHALWKPDMNYFYDLSDLSTKKTSYAEGVDSKTYNTLKSLEYGSLYSFTVLTSAEECSDDSAEVQFSSIAINAPTLPEQFRTDISRDISDDIYNDGEKTISRSSSLGSQNRVNEEYEQFLAVSKYALMNVRFGYLVSDNDGDKLNIIMLHKHSRPGEGLSPTDRKSINLDYIQGAMGITYAPDVVQSKASFKIVGRIGNLALHDTGDFRYSNLFKKVNSGNWLIPNVIESVDPEYSVAIGTTVNDILEHPVVNYGYATTSTTAQIMKLNWDNSMANILSAEYGPKWIENTNSFTLPLTPKDNNVEEFKNEPVRLGYSSYFDIETFGNYFADGTGLTIIPHYVLYDYKTGEFIEDIEIWYGSESTKNLCYNSDVITNGDKKSYHTTDVGLINKDTGIYLDISKDDLKRYATNSGTHSFVSNEQYFNIEKYISDKVKPIISTNNGFAYESIYDMQGDINIGNTSLIKLTTKSSAATGTRFLYGLPVYKNSWKFAKTGKLIIQDNYSYNGNSPLLDNYLNSFSGLDYNANNYITELNTYDGDFAKQAQKWYFNLKLPSSAYITSGVYTYSTDGNTLPNQYEIVANHEQLQNQHPNAVIVCFLEIYSKSDTWLLEYDATLINGGTSLSFELFDLTKDGGDYKYNVPTGLVSSKNTIKVSDITNKWNASDINKPKWDKWQPVCVYTAWENSSMDLTVGGTH